MALQDEEHSMKMDGMIAGVQPWWIKLVTESGADQYSGRAGPAENQEVK